MGIKEQGYTHWDGELKAGPFSWKPIMRYGVKLTFKKKFFKMVFFLAVAPALVFLIGIYISERVEDFQFMVREASTAFSVNPAFFQSYFTNNFILFMMVMILVFAGAGLIADDLKYNSLQLYFSRPIRKRDFFAGKISVIAFFLLIMTLIPGILLFLMKMVFAGSFRFFLAYPWLPLSIIGYSFFITGFFSCYALFLSSLSKNRRYVAVLIFGVYFFSDILFAIFYGIFRKPVFYLLSLKSNLKQVGAFVFGQKPEFDVPWIYSLLIVLVFCVVAGFLLNRKVRGVEIVK